MAEEIIDWGNAKRYISQGYVKLRVQSNGVSYYKFEHIVIWEAVYGAKPEGFDIHHIDGKRDNNVISNLMCIDKSTHARIHAGWKMIEGEWWRYCSACGQLKLETEGFTKDGCYCKSCMVKYRIENIGYQKAYRDEHIEQASRRRTKYYSEHKEEERAKQKQYNAEHKRDRREYQKEYRATHEKKKSQKGA